MQVFDILWSDPQVGNGCIPNALRGAGTYFGPDVTKRFLEKNRMMYLVRSHECKPEGYEVIHENLVRKTKHMFPLKRVIIIGVVSMIKSPS